MLPSRGCFNIVKNYFFGAGGDSPTDAFYLDLTRTDSLAKRFIQFIMQFLLCRRLNLKK